MIIKAIKKPVQIEAVFYDGKNHQEVLDFCGDKIWYDTYYDRMIIGTLEGNHLIRKNDYIIKGVKGEFYPCKQDIFEQSYEVMND